MGLTRLAIFVGEPYDRNRLFDPNSPLNRDNCLAPFRLLKEQIEKAGGTCSTYDVFERNALAPDIVLFLDMPRSFRSVQRLSKGTVSRLWVILQETDIVLPQNWEVSRHRQFEKIFTWNDDLVDGRKYFKINFAQAFPDMVKKGLLEKSRFCCLIAGNKKSSHPKELYSKRIEAVRWFEKQHPGEFDLYGTGWDAYRFSGPRAVRALNKIRFLTRLFAPHFPSFRGSVPSKMAAYEQYQFAICYENACDIPGYITEKIFDCFFAGCIPVYWGANNVTDHIPPECFIDKRKFGSYEELYAYLKAMSEAEYRSMLVSIEAFLKSSRAYPFSAQAFAGTILREMSRG